MHMRRLLLASLLATAVNAAFAGQPEADLAYRSKDYARAAALYLETFAQTQDAGQLYNAACSFALAGEGERALATLRRAVDAGYMNAEHTA
jgi:hypothetical protein